MRSRFGLNVGNGWKADISDNPQRGYNCGMSNHIVTAVAFLISGCAPQAIQQSPFARVTVDQLNASPATWDGKLVEVVGVASRRFENLGLYSSFDEYCSHSAHRIAIYVQWDEVRDFRPSHEGRQLLVRGVFRNENGTERPTADGMVQVTISTGAPGPGPLTDVSIIKRLSERHRGGNR